MPDLSDLQKGQVRYMSSEHPDLRLIASPMLSLRERSDLLSTAGQVSYLDKSTVGFAEFEITVLNDLYMQLLQDPESPVELSSGVLYGLHYGVTHGGLPSNRKDFTNRLIASGRAIVSADLSVWLLNFIDVSSPIDYQPHNRVWELESDLPSTVLPETLLALHILLTAEGRPDLRDEVQLVNEFICMVRTPAGYPTDEIVGCGSIGRSSNKAGLTLNMHTARHRDANFVVRTAFSAIQGMYNNHRS